MYRLYDYLPSGNGYKVRLTLTHIGVPFELVEVDIVHGESRTPAFLSINANGRIPVLELDDGSHLSESHAICWYLAERHRSALLPDEPLARARVLEHLCFEQYNLEPNVATLRFLLQHAGETPKSLGERYETKRRLGHAALAVLERRLDGAEFLVGDSLTLADIGLYAYTHVAEEGTFELAAYPRIRAWLARIAAVPGHIPIDARPAAG